jgi:hypothetical protein
MLRASTLLLLALALAGCPAGSKTYGSGALAGTLPPPAAGAIGPRWDHYCAIFAGGIGGEAAFASTLDQASNAGWEMVGVTMAGTGVLFCFKRPRAAPAPVTPPA